MEPDDLPIPAWTSDGSGTIVASNASFRALYGRPVRSDRELWPTGAAMPAELLGGSSFSGRVLHLLADGRPGEVELERRPLPDGRVLSIAVDRSAERRISDALSAAKAEIERVREELKRAATHDPVTGTLAARELHRLIRLEMDRCRRYGRSFAALSVQITGFEALSERLAQHGTEAVLQRVARACSDGRRSMDLVGRLDGGRFALALPETPASQAAVVAERIRRGVESAGGSIVPAGGAAVAVPVRVRVGIAGFPGTSLDPDALIAEAGREAS
jgi:diguanylate cyclase (GGDEF)-like protein